ncbi:MAG: hypothetical protein OXG23_14655 [Chloroflexi bacterium]|nr:hypothetical protein [Chloroflexota bacterium]
MRCQQPFFAHSVEMVNQGKDRDDIEYMEHGNSAEERHKRSLTARGAFTSVRDKTAEAQGKEDAKRRPADKQKGQESQ